MSPPQSCEYVVQLKTPLARSRRHDVARAIRASPAFSRSYRRYGRTWYELRSAPRSKSYKAPDATVLVNDQYIYIMRRTSDVRMWHDLDRLAACVENGILYISAGQFFAAA